MKPSNRCPQLTTTAPLRGHQRERHDKPTEPLVSSTEGGGPTAHDLLQHAGLLNKTWSTDAGPLTGAMLLAAFTAIRRLPGANAEIVAGSMALECPSLSLANVWTEGSDRRTDRALQLLKRAGLVEFDKKARAWRATR